MLKFSKEKIMQSSWDETRARSRYHFDPTRMDPLYDTVNYLGQFAPCWQQELEAIVEESRPATWATRGYKGQGVPPPQEDLAAEEHDLARIGADPDMTISNIGWDIPLVLQRISNLFGLDDTMNRLHVQWPGQVWTMHIDKLQKWAPKDPDSIMRVMIQLTDWQPGHFWNYGNHMHQGWRAGDVTTFDWQNVPHSTANAGHVPRVTFQITGVITDQTRNFLRLLRSKTPYTL
jgi:hypothetical protein